MPTGSGRNVYLIRQNVEHLYGAYLTHAVVLAPGPGRAVRGLLRHVRLRRPEAIARRSRLSVVRIGENAPDQLDLDGVGQPGGEVSVVAVAFGEDNDR